MESTRKKSSRYSAEVRERAVRMVQEALSGDGEATMERRDAEGKIALSRPIVSLLLAYAARFSLGFPARLSLRDIEEELFERDVVVTYGAGQTGQHVASG